MLVAVTSAHPPPSSRNDLPCWVSDYDVSEGQCEVEGACWNLRAARVTTSSRQSGH
jgi:hypothetical protein